MHSLGKRAIVGLGVGFVLGGIAVNMPLGHAGKRAAEVVTEGAPIEIPPTATAAVPTASFAPLVDAVRPAVVSIEVETTRGGDLDLDSIPAPFRQFVDPHRSQKGHGLGSGFVISPEGLVLTNNHVIQGATEIKAQFADGREVLATVVGTDPATDIALLKLEGDDKWPFVELGSSGDLRVGDWVVAVGNPLGLGITVTAGIVSGTGRVLGHDAYDDFIQTDAAINQGNSGGPLFDTRGKVVGVNTAIIQGANSVGFAVPADMVADVVSELQTDGRVSRGYLGVQLQSMDVALARALKVPGDGGALVASVQPGTPAAEAGMRDGDVITGIAGKAVTDSDELVREVARHDPGEQVELSIVRAGAPKKLKLTLAERPGSPQEAPKAEVQSKAEVESSRLGVSLGPVPPELARRLGTSGVMVREVEEGSPAEGKLIPGDLLVEIDGQPVASPEDVRSAIKGGGDLVLKVLREGEARYLAISR
jgi:serine protease Do